MPKITMKMAHPPTFEYDIPQEKLDEMDADDLKSELTTRADIDLAEGAGDYDTDDWTLTIED